MCLYLEMMGRPKENRGQLRLGVNRQTPSSLKAQAHKLGYIYNNDGATGKYLDAIASSQVIDLGDIALIVIRKSADK